jgi:DNA polymerase I-like protein with 3'-5' exonuclease and polymerase domains
MNQIRMAYISQNNNLRLVQEELDKSRLVGFDAETYGDKKDDGLDPHKGKIRLVQINTVEYTFILDLQKLAKAAVKEIVEPLLYDRHTVKVIQNGKFDLKFCCTYFGIDLRRVRSIFCTRVAHKLVKGGTPCGSKLSDIALECLGVSLDKSEQTYDWGKTIYKEQVVYAGIDSAILLPIYRVLSKAMTANNLELVGLTEMRCVPAVAQLELNGLGIDVPEWRRLAEIAKDQLYLIEKALREDYGFGNIGLQSNKEMHEFLSEMVGYPVKSRAAAQIEKLIEDYKERVDMFGKRTDYRPALIKYLEYLDFAKDVSTYGFSFLDHINSVTGRIHGNFNQNDTNTQRFSSSSPNLQNIPRDSDLRACFIPAEGKKFVRFDYSQIELRLMAQFTKDEVFLRAFREHIDLHRLTAATEFDMPFEEVPDTLRQDMKPINFGIPYGMGKDGLAVKLGITPQDAAGRLKRYFNNHPWITNWHQQQFRYFKAYNCVRTPSGRLRALTQWRHNNDMEWHAKQAAKNFPIQAACADIIKSWIVKVFHDIPEADLVLTVHDENMWEADEKYADEIAVEIERKGVEAGQEIIPDIEILLEGGVSDKWKK